MFAAPGWAEEKVSYRKYTWNDKTKTLSYEDTDTGTNTYTVVGSQTEWGTADTETWYVVNSTLTKSYRITVTGTVNLILCDNATLTASEGITVEGNNKLNIYAQSEGEDMGKLYAGTDGTNVTCEASAAGIGGINNDGQRDGGTVVIHGGTVKATGSSGNETEGRGVR